MFAVSRCYARVLSTTPASTVVGEFSSPSIFAPAVSSDISDLPWTLTLLNLTLTAYVSRCVTSGKRFHA